MFEKYSEISEKLHVGGERKNVKNDTMLLNLRSGTVVLLVEIGELGKNFLQ